MPPRVDINLAEVPLFKPELFIGLHKQFPSNDDPEFQGARDALAEVLAIPGHIRSLYFPAADIPILEFVKLKIPQQNKTFVLSKSRTWYSSDVPTTDVACLMSRPIPPKEVLSRLEKEAGQAWFDGCKSILDPRYNDGRDRFPLWVLTFWKEMGELWDAYWAWETSVGWVEGQLEKDRISRL
jgi:hypothetical protein